MIEGGGSSWRFGPQFSARERLVLGWGKARRFDSGSDPVRCTIQEVKPKVCRLFPIDERDLRDRDIIAPDTPCGFSFIPPEEFQARRADEKPGHDASVASR